MKYQNTNQINSLELLIEEYEFKLVLEQDPILKKKYEHEIEDLKRKRSILESTFMPENPNFAATKRNGIEKSFINQLDRTEPVKNFKRVFSRIDLKKVNFFFIKGYANDEHDHLVERFLNVYFSENEETEFCNLFNLGYLTPSSQKDKKDWVQKMTEDFIFVLKGQITNKLILKQISDFEMDFSFLQKNQFLSEYVLFFSFKISDKQWDTNYRNLLSEFTQLWNFNCTKPIFVFINIVHEEEKGILKFISKNKLAPINKDLEQIVNNRNVFDLGFLEKISFSHIEDFLDKFGIAKTDDFIKKNEEISWQEAYERCKKFVKEKIDDEANSHYRNS